MGAETANEDVPVEETPSCIYLKVDSSDLDAVCVASVDFRAREYSLEGRYLVRTVA